MPQQTPRHRRTTNLKTFLFGAPYYPEHWTEDDRADDPSRMAAAGVNCVRMAEFAWDLMEPEPGRHDFSFFDAHVNRLGRAGIWTILCTPTAAPPRWLSRRHPELLRIDADGKLMPHGTRQHCCTNHPLFRQFSRQITKAMAQHYAANQHVIGWQTDNELHCHFSPCYCLECIKAFQQWCRARYGRIEELNRAWGNAFWALTYFDFGQVLPPYDRPARANPSQVLDWHRFVSDATCSFQREQVEILRQARGGWFVTHNGLMRHIDYSVFARDLDFLGVDIYPCFAKTPATPAVWADTARAHAGNFIVPELQSGPGGQIGWIGPTPPPGQMRLWAYQAIAHGADAVLHFRWRSCRFGAEEYWCGVLDHDNKPRRRYEEFSQEGNELRHFGGEILGTSVQVAAGVLIEYDQDQAHAAQPLGMPSPTDQARTAHAELWRRKLPVGMVEAGDSFEALKLLVLPSFTMISPALAEKLEHFVRGGGVLAVTAFSGTRDVRNQVLPITPPGLLTPLVGATVEEFTKLNPDPATPPYGCAGGEPNAIVLAGRVVPARLWAELLKCESAEAVGTWQSTHFAGYAGLTVNRVGQGVCIYVGTYLSEQNVGPIFDLVQRHARIEPVLPELPEPVEATRRVGPGHELLFLLNHDAEPHTIHNVPAGRDLISGQNVSGQIALPGREVAIIRIDRRNMD